jgi:hypothetical protein
LDVADSLSGLVDRTAATGLSYLREDLPKKRVQLRELWLPKYKLSFSGQMNDSLR